MATQKTNIWIDGAQAGSTLKELQKEVNKLNREIKDLPRNSDEYKKKVSELSQANKAIADHRAQVKGIPTAFDQATTSLKGMLQQYGPATAMFTVIGGAIAGFTAGVYSGLKGVVEFDTAMADLSAVTGQTGSDLKFLEDKAIEFSTKYGESAADIATAIKLAGSARPELLANGAAMADFTEKAILLSKASGDDVPTSISNLAGTLNAFELDAKDAAKVMDVLANAAQLGSQEIPYLNEAFTKFGGIAAANGVSVAESAAAIELLGKKFPEAAAAGTGFRNILLKLSAPDALPKEAQAALQKLGVSFKTLQDSSKPFSERLGELKPLLNDNAALIKVFGTENALAAQTLIQVSDEIDPLKDQYGELGTTQEQAAINSATLQEAWSRMVATFQSKFMELRGSSGDLVKALDWVSKNFDLIVSAIGNGIKAFLYYKAAMTALKIGNFVKELGGLKGMISQVAEAFKQNASAATTGGSAVSKFGGALKSVGWTVIIAVAVELGMELYNIASGAKQAEENLKRLDQTRAKSAQEAQQRSSKRKEDFDKEIAELQRKRNENKITEEEFIRYKQYRLNLATKEIQADIQATNNRKKVYAEQAEFVKKQLKALGADTTGVNLITNTAPQIAAIEQLQKTYGQLQANAAGAQAKVDEYRKELTEVTEASKDAASEQVVLSQTVNQSGNAAKKASKDYADMLAKLIEMVDVIQDENIWDARLSAMQDGQDKELLLLQRSLDDKYADEIAMAQELEKQKGDIAIKAREQLNRLLQLKDQEYADKSLEITEKYAKEKKEKEYEEYKDGNLKALAQQESLEDAMAEIKVGRAKAVLNSINETDLKGRREAINQVLIAEGEALELKKQRQIEALYDQYDQEEISAEELKERKKFIEEEFQVARKELEEQTLMEIAQMNFDRIEQAVGVVNQFIDVASKNMAKQAKKEEKELEKRKDFEMSLLEEQLRSQAISEEEYQQRKDAIETEYQEKQAKLKNDLAKKQQIAALAQAAINGALAITRILAEAPATAPIAIPIAVATTAAQMAAIAAQEVEQYADGGYTNVIGAKDGKHYNAKNVGRLSGGMTPASPSLALISEQGPEYFVPYHMMRDQRVANHVSMIEAIRTNQYADGGFTSGTSGGSAPDLLAALERNSAVMAMLAGQIPNMKAVVDEKQSYKVVDTAVGLRRNRA